MSRRLLCLSALVALVLADPAAAAPPAGPPGDAFYRPPADLVPGPEGSIIWARPATGLAVVPTAARTTLVLYRSQGVTGAPVAVSGTVVVPPGAPPAGGWPVAAWSHVTTGAGDDCAPSRVTADNPERRRMLGDTAITRRLLRQGVAVVRSDYEGIGTPGPHPYLIGASLARATVNMVRAGRALEPRLGARWAAVGHSEGGAASLFAAQDGPGLAPELDLRGAAALTPPVTTRESLQLGRLIPVAAKGVGGLTALGALVLGGAAAADPSIGALYRAGGLSPQANAHMADLDTRCLTTLGLPDSFGAIAPADIPGPRSAELERRVYPMLDANNPANVRPAVPVRIDAGALDLITPAATLVPVARRMRARGADVTFRVQPLSSHPSIVSDAGPVREVTDWVTARLR